jgi:hypothetical protein
MSVCLADDANHREFPGDLQDEMSRSRYHAPAPMTSGQNTLSEKSVKAIYVFETRLNLCMPANIDRSRGERSDGIKVSM